MKFLTDEHIPPALARGLRRAHPGADILELRQTELLGRSDPVVLEWAAEAERILISWDASTVPGYAWERVAAGRFMAGVFIWRRTAPLQAVLEDLQLIIRASSAAEWEAKVVYLPLS